MSLTRSTAQRKQQQQTTPQNPILQLLKTRTGIVMSSSSSFPSCFRPSADDDHHTPPPLPPPPLPPSTAGKTNLTTCVYTTNLGLFSLTWSSTFLGHSLHLNLHPSYSSSPLSLPNSLSSTSLHFRLDVKLLTFWKKQGHKKLAAAGTPNLRIFWDFSRAKFGSVPEPVSGFYIAVVAEGEMALLVGDLVKQAYSRTKAQKPRRSQSLVLRREHLVGNKVYSTRARFGGKTREICIDCRVNESAKLCISVDGERVLQIKRLKWKFRGNEKVEVDGVWIQVSWDVYNWLFDKDASNGHAVFMFKFEEAEEEVSGFEEKQGGVVWQQQSSCGFGMSGTEWRKMRKSFLRSGRSSSSSSISMSSASSGGGSSVLEWASSEESELGGPGSGSGFSLLVYAWKK